MEDSIIFELLEDKYVGKYREELSKEENNFTKWINQSREALEKAFNKEQLNLADNCIKDIQRHEYFIDYQVGIKILNYEIKIGMELNKAFSDIDNK